jgi:hypothetical protein
MDNGVKYLVNSDDFIATRIALMNAKATIAELVTVYKLTSPSADVNSLIRQKNELEALLDKLNYHKLNVSMGQNEK